MDVVIEIHYKEKEINEERKKKLRDYLFISRLGSGLPSGWVSI
jgi:hypothetical protein